MKGQVIESSECEIINLPIVKTEIKNIFQIIINVNVISTKNINTPVNNIVVVDGVKKFKIIYYDKFDKASILYMETPFNTFIEMPNKKIEINNIKVYVLDCYFNLVNPNSLYSHIVYYINVEYTNRKSSNINSSLNLASTSKIDCDSNYIKESTSSKETPGSKVLEEISLSKDNKNNNSYSKKDSTLKNKLADFIDMDEEYL